MPMSCHGCGGPVADYLNFCSWDCQIVRAKADGGTVHCPNGLPIGCIKHDNSMWEHEHGDHPDYKFPIDVVFVGVLTQDHLIDAAMKFGKDDLDDDQVRKMMNEPHALIYADGFVAMSLYECCYATWDLKTSCLTSGSLWKAGDWQLSPESFQKIKAMTVNRPKDLWVNTEHGL